MSAADLDPERWTPLPRPVDRSSTPVRRLADDDVHGLSADEVATVAAAGPSATALDGRRAAVRFWHHAPSATAVALVANGWWRPSPVDACDLTRVAGGWWTIAVDVPDDWQVSYRFVEHRGRGAPQWWERGLRDPGGVAVPDATHTLRHTAGRGLLASVLRLPAADHGWLAGAETTEPRPCRPAGSRWQCWSWVAPGGEDPLPLLVVTDGRPHVEQLGTHRVLQAVVDRDLLPPLAAIFIDSGPDRPRDLGAPGGQARWIGEDLVPTLRRDGVAGRAITRDPGRTVVAGSSFGGLTALFAAARTPEVVGAGVVQSPSFWRYPEGALVAPLLAADRRHPLRLRLQAGTEEGLGPAAEAVTAALADDGVDATCAGRSGGHDWAWWVPGLVEATADLLRPRRGSD